MVKISLKLTAALVTFALSMSPVAYAQATEASNSTTGSGSTNVVDTQVDTNTTITNSNEATVNNTFDIQATTGNNSASDNTGDGTVKSGDIAGSVDVVTAGNVNSTDTKIGASAPVSVTNMVTSSDIVISSSNSNTGSGSDNSVNTTYSNRFDVSSTNTANVHNNINLNSNTGYNKANDNTGNGSVVSGDIVTHVALVTCLNFNFVNGDNATLPLCVPTVEKPVGGVSSPVPFVQEPTPVVANVLVAAANPAPANSVNVLSAQTLPVTGSNVNFTLLLAIASLLTLSGFGLRQSAKRHLDRLTVKSPVRLTTAL